MSKHPTPKGGRLVTRTITTYDVFGIERSLPFLVDAAGEPVGLEIDRCWYRIKLSPRLRLEPGWRLCPMVTVETIVHNDRCQPGFEPEREPDPAA